MAIPDMQIYGTDLFDEPDGDPDTLAQLGPLRALAGIWQGSPGFDDHPVAGGTDTDEYVETYSLQPIDRQTNGPQLFYGLRYHTHVVEVGKQETFHDQVGYWLWEPATDTVILSLAIPRAQVALASGSATADATTFTVRAEVGAELFGILSNPFLDRHFHTTSFEMTVTVNEDGTWSYDQDTVLEISDREEPFHHRDRNTLSRVAEPELNPLAIEARDS